MDGGERIGGSGDCIGLVISSYSDSEISFALGSGYTLAGYYDPVENGDSYSMTVLGTTFDGTVAYPAKQASTGPFAYMTSDAGVTVVDTSTHAVVGSPITVGSAPDYVAITPNGADAFVSNNSSGSVSEIATSTNQVVATITLANARGMAMAPNGSTVYVSGGADDNQLYPIDTATDAVGSPVTVGGGAAAVALTPDGTHAFVVNQLDGTVTDVDLANSTTVTVPTGLSLPGEDEMAPDGDTVYVDGYGCSGSCGALVAIDVATDTAGTPLEVGVDASRFAITPDGTTAWVGIPGTGTIWPPSIWPPSPSPRPTAWVRAAGIRQPA